MRYGLLYFTHFLALGAYAPYLPLYLARHTGLGQAQIGWVLATVGFAGLLGPFVWGPLVDRTNRRRLLMGFGLAATAALYPLYLLTGTFPAILLLTVFFGAMLAPTAPLADDLTLHRIRTLGGDYGRTRLWGSVAFIVSSTLVGWLLDVEVGTAQFLLFSVAELAALAVLLSFRAEDISFRSARRKDLHFWRALNKTFVVFLAATLMGKIASIGHSTFYSLYLDSIGVSDWLKGIAWSVGVVAEIAMMLVAGSVIRRFGSHRLFLVGLIGSAARFFLYAAWPTVTGALVGQVFHAFSFGALHIGSVTLVSELSPPGRTATGQLALAALGTGLGAIAGSLLSGQIAQAWGYRTMYVALAGIAAFGAVLALTFRGRAGSPAETGD